MSESQNADKKEQTRGKWQNWGEWQNAGNLWNELTNFLDKILSIPSDLILASFETYFEISEYGSNMGKRKVRGKGQI